jgi:hypothetical protein
VVAEEDTVTLMEQQDQVVAEEEIFILLLHFYLLELGLFQLALEEQVLALAILVLGPQLLCILAETFMWQCLG